MSTRYRAVSQHINSAPEAPSAHRGGAAGGAGGVPALILTGALNPSAPPAYAQRAARSFKDATVAVFPSLTGDVLYGGPPCISALRLAFLRDPTAKLDVDGCKAKVPPIAFAGTDQVGSTPAGPTTAP